MKGMQKIVHGSGFRGALNYAAERDSPGSEPGRLLGGNMSGITPRDLAAEFGAIRQLRPDIEKPVWHQSLRLPKGDRLDDSEWVKFADDYMERMGFTDLHARTYWLHDDSDGQHIHIVACRVSLDSKVHDSSHQSMKSTPILARMERDYGLTLTPGPEVDQDGKVVMPDKSTLKKAEIEQALRTGEEPPKQKLQRLIDEAKADRPSAVQFAERLEAAGVTAIANLASTGKLNGFSFEVDGIAFKGSQLGKAYAWGQLSKEVSYEQTTDREALERFSAAARRRENGQGLAASDRDDAAARPDAAEPGRPSIEAGASGAGTSITDRREPGRDPESRASGDQGGEVARPSGSEAGKGVQSLGSHIPAIAGIQPATGEGQAPIVLDSRFVFKPADSGAYQRVLDLGGALVKNPAQAAKLEAWKQQHATLQAPAYRLTLTSRRDNLKTYNMGKSKGDDGAEKTYTGQEIAGMIPSLSRQNARGYDIYITPIDPAHHYMVIDDMTAEGVDRLKRSGFAPALVQTSSEGNFQAILKVPKDKDFQGEQKEANKLVQHFNKQLGDPEFSGVIHPFRMAGFSNKKEGRNNFFTRILEGGHRICGRAAQALEEMRDAIRRRLKAAQDEKERLEGERVQRAAKKRLDALQSDAGTHPEKLAKRAYRDVLDRVSRAGWTLDMSRVDFQAAKLMLAYGLSDAKVESLMVQLSPSLADRHSQPEDYARRTVEAASAHRSQEIKRSADLPQAAFERDRSGRTITPRPKG